MNLAAPILIVFGITALNDLVSTRSVRLTVIFGSAIWATFMFVLNELSPQIALAFAWVAAITVLFTSGASLFTQITKGLSE